MGGNWNALFPGEVPAAAQRVLPHLLTTGTLDLEGNEWIANLDEVATLEPAVVVAGHKKVENDNNPKIIGESQQYLRDFSRIAAEETTAAGIVARMVERYPG
jgi:hypothetical protein